MKYFEFLASSAKVDTIIGLLAFIVAAFLGYLTARNSSKMKHIGEIIDKADTQSKADLATALAGVMPGYKIPELSKRDGFEVVKLQLAQRADEFKARLKVLKVGMVLLFILIIALVVKSYIGYTQASGGITTTGNQSPILIGDSAHIEYNNNSTSSKDSTP